MPPPEPEEPLNLTSLLEAGRLGDSEATERALEVLYGELRKIAGARMREQAPSHTLQATALVNEAYLRIMSGDQPWESRRHFYCVAARAMRSVLIDHARARKSAKRGGDREREPLTPALAWFEDRALDVEVLAEAIDRLGRQDARKKQVVELRFFAGMSSPQVAEVLDVSLATVERDWSLARAWLSRALEGPGEAPAKPQQDPA